MNPTTVPPTVPPTTPELEPWPPWLGGPCSEQYIDWCTTEDTCIASGSDPSTGLTARTLTPCVPTPQAASAPRPREIPETGAAETAQLGIASLLLAAGILLARITRRA